MYDLNATQRDIICVAAGLDEPHGLGIKEELDDYYGTDVNPGRLYPNLDKLAEKGLITKGQVDERTNTYTLTERARRELISRRDWESQYTEEHSSEND